MLLTAFDSQQLELFTRQSDDLFDADDPASMTSCYTEDAQLMADGIQPIQGHAAIRQFWRAAVTRAAAARARCTIQLRESHSSGDQGYALCTVTIQVTQPRARPGTSSTCRESWDAIIWQRDPSGNWRIANDTGPHERAVGLQTIACV